MPQINSDERNDLEKTRKIDALREMINNAEKTIQSAKAMLLQLEGKKKVGRKRKMEEDDEGTVVEGTFDGQIMLGTDGKQYPVPANYASKSKLVEGDMLKLTITHNGSFVYKQIGPIERAHALGVVSQDEKGNYYVFSEGKPYKVLLASITYFKAEPGDEVAIVRPREIESSWASIENVLQKGGNIGTFASVHNDIAEIKKEVEEEKILPAKSAPVPTQPAKERLEEDIDEWLYDIEELEKEIKEEQAKNKE